MGPEMNWSNIEFNHVVPLSSIDVSKDEGLRKCFSYTNAQSLLKKFGFRNVEN